MTFTGYTSAVERLNFYGPYDNTDGDSVPDPSIFHLATTALDTTRSIMALDFYNGSSEATITGSLTSLSSFDTPRAGRHAANGGRTRSPRSRTPANPLNS